MNDCFFTTTITGSEFLCSGGESEMINLTENQIPQLTSDPSSPETEAIWVKKTSASTALKFPLMALGLTLGGTVGTTYQLSFRTEEGTTVRATMS